MDSPHKAYDPTAQHAQRIEAQQQSDAVLQKLSDRINLLTGVLQKIHDQHQAIAASNRESVEISRKTAETDVKRDKRETKQFTLSIAAAWLALGISILHIILNVIWNSSQK